MSGKKRGAVKEYKIKIPHVRVVKNFPHLDDNDPVLIRKKEEFLESLKEAPLPEYILKRIEK